jgi:hypothetical protein
VNLVRRLFILLAALAMSLVALRFRSGLQAWAYGVVAPATDKAAPELPALKTLDGAPLRLGGLRGRVVLLHFWTFG